MATVMDVIKGIQQAAANAHDGSHDERFSSDGESRKAGLKREEGDLLVDKRLMDGFNVRFQGNHLIVSYHSEIPLKSYHDNSFESDTGQHIADVVKFLKKEYKKVTGNTLSLTAQGEVSIFAQNMSKIRTWVQASRAYKIGGLKGVETDQQPSEDRLDKSVKKWLAIGKDKYPGAKKPKNVTA